ncbi:MAG: hypothetical protein M3279_06455 [Actinomycetota bacterium]|nr:hypothetical protein [Actinomycetota bacterium]
MRKVCRVGLVAVIAAVLASLLSPVAQAATILEPCEMIPCTCYDTGSQVDLIPSSVCYPDPCPTLDLLVSGCDVSIDGLLADPTKNYPDCDIDAVEPFADDGIMYAQASYTCDRKVPDITLTVCLEHAAGPPVGICKTKKRLFASSTGQVYDKEPCVPGVYRTWAIATWGEKAALRDFNEQEMHAPAFPFFTLIADCDYTQTLFDPMELVESPVDVEVEPAEESSNTSSDASEPATSEAEAPVGEEPAPSEEPEPEPSPEPEPEPSPEPSPEEPPAGDP